MTDTELLAQFESQELPFDLWTHRMHVRIAYLYAKEFPFEEALSKLRNGIQAYNSRNNVEESTTSGYNETMTVAYLRLIRSTLDTYESIFPTSDSEVFCDTHPHLLTKTILRVFYSPEQRLKPEAKTEFMEPDLSSLPEPN